jgi:serine/threonine protein kinase
VRIRRPGEQQGHAHQSARPKAASAPRSHAFIAQEFVDGEPLGKLVPLPLREALTVASGVADALADAHDNGFIHRDVKPSNVIVPRVGGGLAYDDAKLLDFGVAGLLVEGERKGPRLTAVGQFFGTPLYMSPEQWGVGRQGSALSTAKTAHEVLKLLR